MTIRSFLAAFLSFTTLALSFAPMSAQALERFGPAADQDNVTCEMFTTTLLSDTTAIDATTNAPVVPAYVDGRHTASIPGATWIWPTEFTTDAKNGEQVTIARDFVVAGTPMGGVLDIAVDNEYRVFVNGALIGEDDDSLIDPADYPAGTEVPYNFTAAGQDSYTIPASVMQTGVNTLVIEARNRGSSFTLPEVNPAGILYKLDYAAQDCPTVCELVVTSDQTTQSTTNNGDSVSAYTDGRHTASIEDAEWIWSTEYTIDPKNGETQEFSRTFTMPTDTIEKAELGIAADNSYVVTINGVEFGGDDDKDINPADYFGGEVPYNFTASGQDTWDITSLIQPGLNTIHFSVRNWGSSFTVPEVNPAAFMYRVVVTGESQNETCERRNTPPAITLIGDNPLVLAVGDTFTDPGATAFDREDGTITSDIVIGGDTVDTTTAGTYTLTYNVEDSAGLTAPEVTRTVIVEPAPVIGDQCILESDLNTTVVDLNNERLLANSSSNAEGPVVPFTLPAGEYRVSLQSFDGYTNRVNVSQPNESFAVRLFATENEVAVSSKTPDLADSVLSDYFAGVVDETLVINEAITSIQAFHPDFPSGANSVEAVCASFERLTDNENTPPTLSADPAVVQTSLPTDDTVEDLLRENAVASDVEDGNLTSTIVVTPATTPSDQLAVLTQVMLELGFSQAQIDSLTNLLGSGPYTQSILDAGANLLNSYAVANADTNYILVMFYTSDKTYTLSDTPSTGYYGAFFDVSDSAGASAPTDARIVQVLPEVSPNEIPVISVDPQFVVLERGESFDVMTGVTAFDNEDGNLTDDIITGGDTLDVTSLGTYTITYDVADSDENDAVQKTRVIQVVAGEEETGTVLSCLLLLDKDGNPINNPMGGENFQIDYDSFDSLDAYFDTPLALNTELPIFTGDAATCITKEFPVGDYSYDKLQVLDDSETFVAYVDNAAGWAAPLYFESPDTTVTLDDFKVFDTDASSDGDITVDFNTTQYVMVALQQSAETAGEIPVITVDPTTINLSVGADTPNLLAGVTAMDNEDGVITPKIVTGGDTVDTSTVGTYTVTYNVTDSDENDALEKTRTYIVTQEGGSGDNAPSLTLVGENPLIVFVGNDFTDPGATAADVEDGDLTDEIVVGGDTVTTNQVATFTITYNVTDSDGNTAPEVTRTVEVRSSGGSCNNCTPYTPSPANTPPTITLEGDNPLQLVVGQTFTEPGYVAQDTEDGTITSEVVVGGDTVDTSTPGTYALTYNVTDSGNLAAPQVTRTVVVGQVLGEVFPNCELYFTEWLQLGDRGPEVLKVQEWLNSFFDLSIAEDGIYGPETAAAVGYFQNRDAYAPIVLEPWNYEQPTYRWYKTTRMLANHLTGCDESAQFLEDVGRAWKTTDYHIGWVENAPENAQQ